MIGLAAALVLATAKGAPSDVLQGGKTYKATCTLFVLKDCPIANQYAPELQRIIKTYTPRGIQFMIVFEDPDTTQKEAWAHAQTFGYRVATSIDPKHEVAKRYGVTISPSAVVKSGTTVLYSGRIDNLYASIGKRRPAATTHDLREAMDAFLSGKTLKVKRTQAVGCRLF